MILFLINLSFYFFENSKAVGAPNETPYAMPLVRTPSFLLFEDKLQPLMTSNIQINGTVAMPVLPENLLEYNYIRGIERLIAGYITEYIASYYLSYPPVSNANPSIYLSHLVRVLIRQKLLRHAVLILEFNIPLNSHILDADRDPILCEVIQLYNNRHFEITHEQFQALLVVLMSRTEVNPNAVDADGNTALYYALTKKDIRLIRALLQFQSIDPIELTNRGEDILQIIPPNNNEVNNTYQIALLMGTYSFVVENFPNQMHSNQRILEHSFLGIILNRHNITFEEARLILANSLMEEVQDNVSKYINSIIDNQSDHLITPKTLKHLHNYLLLVKGFYDAYIMQCYDGPAP